MHILRYRMPAISMQNPEKQKNTSYTRMLRIGINFRSNQCLSSLITVQQLLIIRALMNLDQPISVNDH